MKKLFVLLLILLFGNVSFATAWVNDAKTLFEQNNAIVMTVNLRTFNAVDINGNGIIEFEKGEKSGTFLNAIKRLDELKSLGVNTIHLLPITPVGSRKALGTAGSLFAMKEFSTINPQLLDNKSELNAVQQAQKFIDACHERNIRVIVEVPAFGAYDMYIKNSKYFLKDNKRLTITPKDYSDVRILNSCVGSDCDNSVYNGYLSMFDMFLGLNVDGVIVHEPSTKPLMFWRKIISHVKNSNPQFVFIAEMYPDKKVYQSKAIKFVSLKKLLKVGFDGYFDDYFNASNWLVAEDFYKKYQITNKTKAKFGGKKFVVPTFVTYDSISPLLLKGDELSKLIVWLNATLPFNNIYVDGFQTGDDYNFELANLKAIESYTDANTYFVNRGKLDIYNFSRKPEGVYKDIAVEMKKANDFKTTVLHSMKAPEFVRLNTNHADVIAYAMTDKVTNTTAVAIVNLNLDTIREIEVKVPRLNRKTKYEFVKNISVPTIKRGKILTMIAPYDVQVIKFSSFSIK